MLARLDHWDGQLNNGYEAEITTEADVATALDKLDNWTTTQLTLSDQSGNILMVGGGDGNYLVQYLLPEDAGEWIAVNDNGDNKDIELNIGRQQASYKSAQLVDKATATLAVVSFYQTGERGSSINWTRSF